MLRAVEADEAITMDFSTLNPHFAYEDSDTKTRHDLWFLDGTTALNHMRAANDLGDGAEAPLLIREALRGMGSAR